MAKRSQVTSMTSRATAHSGKQQAAPASRGLLLGVLGAVLIIAIGLVVLVSQSVIKPITATDRVGEGTAWGPEGAPVTVIEFSDFGCSHCRTFALQIGPELRAAYEATGKVRFEFRHFPLSPATVAPANAAECAADQGKFWDYHDVLFARQGSSANPFTTPLLKQYAAELGLDTGKFNLCVDERLHLQDVYDDKADGEGRRVNSTPTFFINGVMIQGAQPVAAFKQAIDAALAAVQ